MNFEVGREYLYKENLARLVHIDLSKREGYRLLIAYSEWVAKEGLTELPPHHNFKRGEPVMARPITLGEERRRYFSHIGEDGRPFCFANGATPWSESSQIPMDSVRKLTEEEKTEARKDHEALLQYFSS